MNQTTIDPIEVRIGNYFEYRRQVLELGIEHMQKLQDFLEELKPIPITSQRLARLNFVYQGNADTRMHRYERMESGILFTLQYQKNDTYLLIINNEMRLKQVEHIHQLQNVYYDLTGDVLRRPPDSNVHNRQEPRPVGGPGFEKRSGPGKYRSPKK